ncbi:hypothetical protein FRC17_006198 [Serendipita sp. 399]|nr:hypothetical protein FRC17_006198 [Serendipita sp. 399]
MNVKDIDESTFLLASEHVERLQIHKESCKRLLDVAIENNETFKEQQEWRQLLTELLELLKLWSDLDELERLLQCEAIPETLALIRRRMCELGVTIQENVGGTRTNPELVSSVVALLACPDGLDRLENLHTTSLHKAMMLFQAAMDAVSPASDEYGNIRVALTRLQLADSAATLEAPDLTPHISDISEEPFAKGGFSDVYTGEWLRQGKVALKILRMLGGSGAAKRHKANRFLDEVKLWCGLRHPHLLQFWGLCNTPQGLAMVSPFMAYGNSSAYLAANPEAGALGLLVGAAYGLEYLHTRQPPITHGDLRGANILVSPAGEACLADFGLSKIMEVASADISVGMTTANAGATRWMAPELFHAEGSEYPPSCPSPNPSQQTLLNEEIINPRASIDRRSEDRFEGVTPQSDVWAYGMTLYELMTGKVPYWRIKNSPTVMFTILRGEIPSRPRASDVRHDWQPQLWELMQDCWITSPSGRPTMSKVSDRIRSIREASQMKSPVPQSLLLAFDTPLAPLSPPAPIVESDPQIVIESPTTEDTQLSHFVALSLESEPIKLSSPPRKKQPVKRQSTTDSTLAKAEANDDVPELPELPAKRIPAVSRTDLMRPRSWSAPMALSTDFGVREITASPKESMFQSLNSSLVSLGSDTNQSRINKTSRPITPATPVPDDPQPPTPTSPISRTRQRFSSFLKKNSLERAPPNIILSSEGAPDFQRTILPIMRSLIEGEEAMLANNYDAVFSTRLRTKYPPIIPLDRIDQFLTQILGGYVKLRRQRSLFLKALVIAETTIVSDLVPTLCKLLGETLDHLSSVFPSYAYGIYGVEDKLTEEMEANFPFRAWVQSSEEDKALKQFLKKPMASIETSFVRLSQLVAFAKLHCSKETKIELKLLEDDLVKLLMQTRLRKHQGALGRDEVIYHWRQLVAPSQSHAFADEERQSAIFKIIETQMTFVRIMRDFHAGVLRRIVQAPGMSVPNLHRSFDEMAGIVTLQAQLLGAMHDHQVQSHPILTEIPDLIFESTRMWAGLYGPYSSLLKDAFGELEVHNADIFPLVHALSNPTIADHDLVSLLWMPITHLRRLCKALRALLEVTEDNHRSLKLTVDSVSTVEKIIELCDTLTSSIGSSPEIRQLSTQLQWQEEDTAFSLELEDPQRQVLHSGNLVIPESDSGGFTEVLTIVLDNNLLITIPRMRWGLSSLQVVHSIPLENLEIVDLDELGGIHDLYLVESPQGGETIAAPLPLRFEVGNTQKTVSLLCFTTLEAIEWRRHITAAKLARESSIAAFSRTTLSRGSWVMDTPFAPVCSASFCLNNTTYYLAGGLKAAGLWIRKGGERLKRPLLSGVSVQQCVVLSPLKLLLVLSGKALIFFKLEDIAVSKISSRQVDTKGPVQFFRCGMHRDRPILIAAVGHGHVSSMTIRVYGTAETMTTKSRRSSFFGGKDGLSSTFKVLWEGVVSQQLHGCSILDDCIILMGSDGFLHLNTENLVDIKISPLPAFRGLVPTSQAYQRCKTSKPLNAVRHNGHTLLCYQDFGVHVKDGVIQGHHIDWSIRTATQALCMAPYVLLVNEDAIETRVIASGRLMDCLNGDRLQVTQDTDPSDTRSSIFHLASVCTRSQFDIGAKDDSYSVYEWSAQPTR